MLVMVMMIIDKHALFSRSRIRVTPRFFEYKVFSFKNHRVENHNKVVLFSLVG